MILPVRRFLLLSLISVLLATASYGQSGNSSECNQICGTERAPYPFGFSDACKIKLNCSNKSRMIGKFVVQNLTSDKIFVSAPRNCNRSVEELTALFGTNFRPTLRNSFLLENCSGPVIEECVFLRRSFRSGIGLEACPYDGQAADGHNVSCYFSDLDPMTNEFLDERSVRGNGNCSVLFSSVMWDMKVNNGGLNGNFSIGLDYKMVELGWWLDGNCSNSNCTSNAECVRVANVERPGYRCKCSDGFIGNGLVGGEPCRRVRQRRSHVGFLIAGVMAGALLVAAVAIICYCLRKRTATLQSRLSAKRLISRAAGSASVPFYPYKDIERATNGFSEKQRLGTGAYGTVYAGKLYNEWVAIKKIKYRDHESIEQVMNEIKLLSSVSHPNLVRLLGCCIENGEQILVYEFMPNGTLSQHLQRERGSVLPWTTRLTIAAETSHAIAHLHSSMNPPIYHRDIKSSNILLDYNFNSKVADFGLSRIGMTDDSHVSTAPQGTPGYLDPQYHQNFHLSDKSDVYSFGVVLVEIITAMKVVDFSRPHSEINLAALAIDRIGKGQIDEIIDPYLEPNRDAWTLSSLHRAAELAFRCLAFHRDMRPSMMEVADELEQIRLSSWAPMDENMQMGSSVASSCSSPHQAGSEKSFSISTSRKAVVGSRRLIVVQKAGATDLPIMEEIKDSSPVSVQDQWLSEQSSPSTNSLLGNIAR